MTPSRFAPGFLAGAALLAWLDGLLVLPDAPYGSVVSVLLLAALCALLGLAFGALQRRLPAVRRVDPWRAGLAVGLAFALVPQLLHLLSPLSRLADRSGPLTMLPIGALAMLIVAAGIARLLPGVARTPRGWLPGLAAFAVCAAVFGVRDDLARPADVAPIGEARAAERRPDVLLIVLDTLRADALRTTWEGEVQMPWLEDYADGGTVYSRAYSGSNFTPGGHATFFTGLNPSETGTLAKGKVSLPESVSTVAEELHGFGYRTLGVTSNRRIDDRMGFGQGFEVYDDSVVAAGWMIDGLQRFSAGPVVRMLGGATVHRLLSGVGWQLSGGWEATARAGNTTAATLAAYDALAPAAEEPLFLFVNYYDPHVPYVTREDLALAFGPNLQVEELESARLENMRFLRLLESYTRRMRDGEVDPALEERRRWIDEAYREQGRELDEGLEHLFDGLRERGRLGEDTLVFVVSDHGEHLGEHGDFLHGGTLFEEVVRVPFLVRGPGFEAGATVDVPVSGTDFFPTVLHAMGVPRDAWPRFVGSPLQEELPDRVVVFESGRLRGFVHGSRKMIAKDHGDWLEWTHVYDLDRDPSESRNRILDNLEWALRFIGDPPILPSADAVRVVERDDGTSLAEMGYADEL